MDQTVSSAPKRTLLRRLFYDQRYCWLSAMCTIGIMMLVCYCFGLFPFGDSTILRMDLYHQYGPLFAELYDRVTQFKSFFYSWQTGLGSPFLGNFFNYLSSPAAILILLLGHENMPEAIAGMIIVKAALSACTFTYYLKRSHRRHDFTTAAFGILYAMCGYFVAYYWNVMWMDAMVYFPLIILGIERIIHKRKPVIYIAALTMTLLSNYYMGYMTCVFSVIYYIFYYFSIYDPTSLDEATPYSLDMEGNRVIRLQDRFKGSILLKSGLTFALASLAAAGLAACSLIPTYLMLRNCSATSGTFPSQYNAYFSIFDFLANHLASLAPTIRSSGDDVLPNIYCGIGTIMLVPLYLFSKTVPLREKVASVTLLGIFYFSFNINILNYIWHGFHYPNDLPYRFSFMYCFILLTLAYKAFMRLKEFTGKEILLVGVGLVFAIILIQKIGSKNVSEQTVLISLAFAVTYCLVFAIMRNDKYMRSALAVLMLCCVIGEISCANTDRYSMDQKKQNYAGDYADFRALKTLLDEREGSDAYRMDLTYNRARMDPSWYGYNGVSTFSSMAYERLSNVQSDLGVYGNYINSYTYYLQTPVYNMMHSLKYIVDNNDNVTVENDYYEQLMTVGKFTAYENKYWLPIGMAVSTDMEDWFTNLTNPFTVQADWFEYATGVLDVFGRMDISDIGYYNMDEITSGLDTGDVYFNRTGPDGELTFYLSVPEERHCYLYVNSSAFDSITIGREGSEETNSQNTDEPYIYDLGIVKPDERVCVYITISEAEYGYIDFFPMYVDDEKLNEGYQILQSRALNLTSFEETKLTGTVTADRDSLLFTSIPYDKGWTIEIDGKPIDKDDYVALCDAYLCCELQAGTHTVTFRFLPSGLLIGCAATAATIVCLFGAVLLVRRRRKRLAAAAADTIVLTDDDILCASENDAQGLLGETDAEPVLVELDTDGYEAAKATEAAEPAPEALPDDDALIDPLPEEMVAPPAEAPAPEANPAEECAASQTEEPQTEE
ncbi:MAG: YfhO family protein [Clostridia bacterium]|nr:YfhO family protein [Clostridia bacterium]